MSGPRRAVIEAAAASSGGERRAGALSQLVWRWKDWRNTRLADPAFQHWASRFFLTRRVARRSAVRLFDLTAGFVYAQVLKACVDLDILVQLGGGPASADALAMRAGFPGDRMLLLLEAAESLALVERRGRQRWALGPQGAVLVGNPGLRAMIAHHGELYEDLADPSALLAGPRGSGKLADYWAYAGAAEPGTLGQAAVADYSALMAASQSFVADDVLDVLSLTDRTTLLDLGGGEGAFLGAVARLHPALRLSLMDLPPVAERARRRFSGRVDAIGGDMFRDPLPSGADIICLVRVLHDHDDAPVRQLLARVFAVLPAGGRIAIAEPLADSPVPARIASAYFALYLHAMGSGRPRSSNELAAMLRIAGFENIQLRSTRGAMPIGVITAERPRQEARADLFPVSSTPDA